MKKITLGSYGKKLVVSVHQQKILLSVWGSLLLDWLAFALFELHPSRPRGRERGAPKDFGEQPPDLSVAHQGSGLVAANDAERPAESWHGVKESILILHVYCDLFTPKAAPDDSGT